MSDQLTASIITVTYNCVKYMERSMQSVLMHTYPDIEYLVIDGGSIDGTIDVINRYRERIDYFVSEKDSGIYDAMNKGIRNANGDILFFLNSDDQFCDADVVSDIMKVFNSSGEVDMVYGNVLLDLPHGIKRWHQNPDLSRKSLARNTISHQSIFARKELFIRTDGFPENYKIVGDFVWLMELAHSDIKCMHVERDIANVCTAGISHTSEWEDERIAVMRKYYTPAEIFFWRRVPMMIKPIANYIKQLLRKFT